MTFSSSPTAAFNRAHTEAAFDDQAGIIYLNGELLDAHSPAAKISPGTHSIHYGGAVFDGEIAVNGTIFKSREHSERLLRSAELVGLKTNVTADDIEHAKASVLAANKLQNGYVRAFFYRDPAISVNPAGLETHLCVIAVSKTKYWPDEVYENGMSLITSNLRRIPPICLPQEAKAAANYQVSQLAQMDANAKGFKDALLLDYEGYVAEASVANIFYFKNGVLHTPVADGRFLNGITRQTIIELAREDGLMVIDSMRVTPKEIHAADEIFCTGSATGITPVRQLDDVVFDLPAIDPSTPQYSNFHFKVAGSQTARLISLYAQRIREPQTHNKPQVTPGGDALPAPDAAAA